MVKPIEDVTVLDFSQGAAAPFAGVLLADYGAEVIQVEPPGGASQRRLSKGTFAPNIMRNKQSVIVNLKSDEAEEIIHPLVEEADVLIENNRPGVMDRLGYGYEDLKPLNEGLVYCSVTGYGQTGPYKDRAAFDPIAQAMSGLMYMTGESDRKPSRIGAGTVDLGTGMAAAYAIMVALHHRDNTGEGQHIDTSLIDTAAGAYMGKWFTYYDQEGYVPERMGHTWESYSPVGVFETATEPVYISIPFQNLFERFAEQLGHEEWIDDERFANDDKRVENRSVLFEKIEKAFAEYDREALLDELDEAGIPASKVQTVEEAIEDEHLRERGTITSVETPDGEEVLVGANPTRMSETPPEIETGLPAAGQHTEELLEELGFDENRIERLEEEDVVDGE